MRERKDDIALLFRKFASDFAQKYHMPTLRLDDQAQVLLKQYRWNGNIRQLRNVAEQLSVLEKEREINAELLRSYLPQMGTKLPAVVSKDKDQSDFSSEREILYKVLFDMKNDLNDLKKLTLDLIKNNDLDVVQEKSQGLIEKIYGKKEPEILGTPSFESISIDKNESIPTNNTPVIDKYEYAETVDEEEPLSLLEKEIEMIKQALIRSQGKRKLAAKELGISERTLYRKIKQYDMNNLENE